MATKVIPIRAPADGVLFMSDPNYSNLFTAHPCSVEALPVTFRKLYCGHVGPYTTEEVDETDRLVVHLLESGNADLGDGWAAHRVGVEDVCAFLVEKVVEARTDEQSETNSRVELVRERDRWKRSFDLVAEALKLALGDRGPELVALTERVREEMRKPEVQQ